MWNATTTAPQQIRPRRNLPHHPCHLVSDADMQNTYMAAFVVPIEAWAPIIVAAPVLLVLARWAPTRVCTAGPVTRSCTDMQFNNQEYRVIHAYQLCTKTVRKIFVDTLVVCVGAAVDVLDSHLQTNTEASGIRCAVLV